MWRRERAESPPAGVRCIVCSCVGLYAWRERGKWRGRGGREKQPSVKNHSTSTACQIFNHSTTTVTAAYQSIMIDTTSNLNLSRDFYPFFNYVS